MNKRELIEKAAAEAGLTRRQTAAALDAILGTIQTAVAAEDKVAIPGFGSFEIAHKPARTGRNPQTGEPLEIAETWTAKFKPSPGFMGLIRQRKKDDSSVPAVGASPRDVSGAEDVSREP